MRDIKNHLEEASGTMVAATSRLVAPCGSGCGRTPPWARLPSDPGSACGASGLHPALPGRDPRPATRTCSAAASQLRGSWRLSARWPKSCST